MQDAFLATAFNPQAFQIDIVTAYADAVSGSDASPYVERYVDALLGSESSAEADGGRIRVAASLANAESEVTARPAGAQFAFAEANAVSALDVLPSLIFRVSVSCSASSDVIANASELWDKQTAQPVIWTRQ